MQFGSAVDVPTDAVLRAGVCVIGGGAAGLTVARQLAGTAADVLLLEAGGLRRDAALEATDFTFDELDEPLRNPEPARGRWFGGSTNLWFGRIAVPDRIDFESRPWVAESGWPIGYDEIQPWLRAAAAQLEVDDFEFIDIARWERNPTIDTFRHGGDTDLGVLKWSGAPNVGVATRPILEQSSNVKVILDATVTSIVENEAGTSVESLIVRRPDGGMFSVEPGVVVLASGGLENPRLLLASTARSPRGVGNQRDLVGRYYMDHPRGEAHATADLRQCDPGQTARLLLLGEKTPSPHGPVQLCVTFSEATQRREELLNHCLHAHLVSDAQTTPAFHAAKRLTKRARRRAEPSGPLADDVLTVIKGSPDLARLLASKLARRTRPTGAVFIDQMEQEPEPESRVTVDHRRPDRFGLPRLELRWRIGSATRRSQVRMHRAMSAALADAGIRTFQSSVLGDVDQPSEVWDMKHPSGTTRMASSPALGVVDRECRVHGLSNLYIAGSSVFPTVGHANPTLLIVALAIRLADHLCRLDQREKVGR